MVPVWLYGLSRDLGVTPDFLFLSVSLSLILQLLHDILSSLLPQ